MAKYPNLYVGQRITADLLTDLQTDTAVKPTTETLDSITMQDDDALILSVEANATYRISGVLFVSGPSADDFAVRLNGPSGATLSAITHGLGATATSIANDLIAMETLGGLLNFGTLGSGTQPCSFDGILVVGATAGQLVANWAKITDTSTAVSVLSNSYLEARRVA